MRGNEVLFVLTPHIATPNLTINNFLKSEILSYHMGNGCKVMTRITVLGYVRHPLFGLYDLADYRSYSILLIAADYSALLKGYENCQ